MERFRYFLLLPLLTTAACGQVASRDRPPEPSAQVAAMVDRLYKEVVARHPLGPPDRAVFGPYLSKGLLRRFDGDDACFDRWLRAHPDPNLKPDVGLLEFGAFSGGADNTEPETFQIEKVEPEKDGSYRALVKLSHRWESDATTWRVVDVVVIENGRPVVDDVIYLKQADRDEERLSAIIAEDCKHSVP